MRFGRTWAAVALAAGLMARADRASAAGAVHDLDDPPVAPAAAPPAAASATPPPAGPSAPAPAPAAPAKAPPPPPRLAAPVPPPEPVGPVPWPTVAGPSEAAATATAVGGPAAPAPGASPPQLDSFARRTKAGAYGAVQLFVDGGSTVTAKLPLAVLSVEHRPTDWARIAVAFQTEDGTTTGVQQALVEVSPLRAFGLRAGLLVVPIGLGNLSPAPTSYLTVDLPLTDQIIVPSIWRELGAGIFGELVPGLRYQGALVSGVDGSGLSAEAPLWGTRGDGKSIAAHDAAVVGRVELDDLPPGLVLGGGGYVGGASHGVDALSGLRVALAEADLSYHNAGFSLRAEYARLWIINSYLVNDYLGLLGQSAVPSRGRGFYVEAGYDLLRLGAPDGKQELIVFGGYENVDPRSAMSPYNYNPPAITPAGQLAPEAPSPSRSFVRGGINYRPLASLALKLDLQWALNGEGPAQAPPMVMPGAAGTPRPIGTDVAEAARGATRVGLALAFDF
jgi:hypothetical protein